ncbi:MAG: molybdopterin-dependent oxidoreductase [Chloroflexi bacterium]|nr:molybdopterin-dependent oxidoreductase [Chloroflexota bacterium]
MGLGEELGRGKAPPVAAPPALVALTIDGKVVQARADQSIVEAARDAGIYIPTLCSHPSMKSFGTCRVCTVQIGGADTLVPGCVTPVAQGMVVQTSTPEVRRVQRDIAKYYIDECLHPNACLICHRREKCEPYQVCLRQVRWQEADSCLYCPRNGRCDLQRVADFVGVEEATAGFPTKWQGVPVDTRDPFINRDYKLCIVCGKCVRVCEEVRNLNVYIFTYRNGLPAVGTPEDKSLVEGGCDHCGACVDVCPTGALMDKFYSAGEPPLPSQEGAVSTVCPYCSVGCKLSLEVEKGRLLRHMPDVLGPVNEGTACVKGRFALDFVEHRDRLTQPLVRRGDKLVAATWEEALGLVAERFAQARGRQFMAVASGLNTNEDNYVLQKFTRVAMGSNNIDSSARLSHGATLAGLTEALGLPCMTNSIRELRQAGCILVVGSNVTADQPVLADQIKIAARQGAKLIVINPRRIDLCRQADLWLRPRPGTDMALLAGLARAILENGWADLAFVATRAQGFDAFAASVQPFTPERVAELTGVPAGQLLEAARLYAVASQAAIVYGTGITQHADGTARVRAIADLALLTGQVGKAAAGVVPALKQANHLGSWDMGCAPDLLPGYQQLPQAAAKLRDIWGVEPPSAAGLSLFEMLEAARRGEIKAAYLCREDLLRSLPDSAAVAAALGKVGFLVVQDSFLTATAQRADVVLPATVFAEKEGTFTNLERRIQRLRCALPSPGQARGDWETTAELARRLGAPGFDYRDAAQIMDEIARAAPIYGGVSYGRLESPDGLQWPCPAAGHPGTPLLYAEGFRGGKARMAPIEHRPARASDGYPLALTIDPSIYQFESGTWTRLTPGLQQLQGEELLEVNPEDGRRLGIADGQRVRVVSARGSVETRAKLTAASLEGQVALTGHFQEVPAHLLTDGALDLLGKGPAVQASAVRVERLER